MAFNPTRIYQAPLQGFTDFTFRATVAEVFGGVDKYFIPYLSFGKGREIKKSQLKEVFPENNQALPVVPQVLFSDLKELTDLVQVLVDFGYTEINLNLSCPYPMATDKGRGAAWLAKPAALQEILQQLFEKGFPLNYSVKMRAGLTGNQDFKVILEILDRFPFLEVIFHPRTASQMYGEKANPLLFSEALGKTGHPMIYNGDLFTEDHFAEMKNLLPGQTGWMVGRGLLMDPSLPSRLKGVSWEAGLLRQKKRDFHDRILDACSARLEGNGHILVKMNQFWDYFSESFNNPHKTRKLVKKSGNMVKYHSAVAEIFKTM